MPKYTVRDPRSNKVVTLEGDAPPTEQELHQIFASINGGGEHAWRTAMGHPDTLKGMADPLIGIAKSGIDAVIGAGETAYNVVPGVRHLVDALHGPSAQSYSAAREQVGTPTNDAQRLGFVAGQVGQFVALPAARGGVIGRAATEGTQAGALTAAQGGDARDVALSALTGPIAPVASRSTPAVGAAASKLRESAEANVSQAFNPTGLRNKKLAEQVAPGVLQRGTYALTRQGLKDKASRELDTLSGKFDEASAALPSGDRMPVEPVREVIQQEMLGLLQKGSAGKSVPVNPQKYQALEELDATLEQLGDKVSRETLQAFKEEWGDAVARGGGFAERAGDALTQAQLWAKRKGYEAVRRELAKDAPNIDALNAEWSFWSKVQEVAEATITREKPQKGALRRMGGLLGGVAGFSNGGAQGAVIGAGVGSQLMRVMDSPGWKLASAHAKNKLAEALVSADPERIGAAVGRVVASMPVQHRPIQPVAAH